MWCKSISPTLLLYQPSKSKYFAPSDKVEIVCIFYHFIGAEEGTGGLGPAIARCFSSPCEEQLELTVVSCGGGVLCGWCYHRHILSTLITLTIHCSHTPGATTQFTITHFRCNQRTSDLLRNFWHNLLGKCLHWLIAVEWYPILNVVCQPKYLDKTRS